MSISFDVLGQPGRDNAALVRVDSGQAIHRLLFDCGDGCLSSLGYSEIMSIDHVCFSHFHMDHIAGFDQFFRCNYSRTDKPNHLWGPPNSVEILPHRFQGFWWNLTADSDAAWLIHGVDHNKIETVRLNSSEGFRIVHPEPEEELVGATFSTDDYAVHSMLLDHKGPSVAYKIVEPTRSNVAVERLSELGLRPGAWIRDLKEASAEETIQIDGTDYACGDLRAKIVVEQPGESLAYVTDFALNAESHARLTGWLSGCDTVICEAQYAARDEKLARRNFHATTRLVAELAQDAAISELVLFHLSDRYTNDQWGALLQESQAIFPNTRFPDCWDL